MSFIIKKASKKAKKLRIGFSASSGSGKTYSSLLAAYGLCGDWSKIGLIDTERGSANLYANLGEFNIIELDAPYSPERYIEAIELFEKSGMEVIIIDSITHEWSGKGGCLEIHSKRGGEFRHWASVTPRHNAFIDKILRSSTHMFCTVRRKEEYALNVGQDGRTKVQKLGLQEQTRDGFSYEMDLVFEIANNNHHAYVTKDRTNLFVDVEPFLITVETGRTLKDWADKGRNEIDDALDLIRNATTMDDLKNIHLNFPNLHHNPDYISAKNVKKKELSKN